MKFLSRMHRKFIDLPLRTKLVLVFAFTMFMVAFVNIYMHVSINNFVGTIDKVYASNVSLNQLVGTLDDVQENMFRYLNTKSTAALNDYYVSEQSYSERQIYRSALERLCAEIALIESIDEDAAAARVEEALAQVA